ncbi:MAG TPA: alpha-hydroxy acid oxidase [Acidobacteriota bacterium]|jgi:isopentenyl diphosphate isomerase/L-lactate dehydrogenase-like FMN-dependent dehydrogenase
MNYNRRHFLRFLALSPLFASVAFPDHPEITAPDQAFNVFQFEETIRKKLPKDVNDFISGGADDEKTIQANRDAFDQVEIRARRLVNVSKIDTSTEILGQPMETPILISPVGFQKAIHPDGELAVARAAASHKHLMIASTVSSYSIEEISSHHSGKVWFQLYPTSDRSIAKDLLQRAESSGCPVVALTVDTPVLGTGKIKLAF